MMKEEKSRDYLSPSRTSTVDGNLVTESDRRTVVDLMFSIVRKSPFDIDMVVVAMGMVDRFLSKPSNIAQDALQDMVRFKLVAISALSICITSENNSIIPGSEFLADESNSMCSFGVSEIKDMESKIKQGLSSGLFAPTSLQMAKNFLSLALPGVNLEESRWSYVLDDVRFQADHAVGEYYFTTQFPSTIAMAAILNAFDEITGSDLEFMLHAFPSVLSNHVTSLTDLLDTKSRLRDVAGRDYDTSVSDTMVEMGRLA